MSLPTVQFKDGAGVNQWSPAHQIGAVGAGTAAAQGTYVPVVSRDTGCATYTAGGSIAVASMAASLADLVGIRGSATKTVRVKRMRFDMGSTTGLAAHVTVKKHTVANTGGTAITTPDITKLDSGFAAGTALPIVYSANPTTDATATILAAQSLTGTALTTAAGVFEIRFVEDLEQAGVLRGVAQELFLNFGGTTPGAGTVLNWWIVWTEESES